MLSTDERSLRRSCALAPVNGSSAGEQRAKGWSPPTTAASPEFSLPQIRLLRSTFAVRSWFADAVLSSDENRLCRSCALTPITVASPRLNQTAPWMKTRESKNCYKDSILYQAYHLINTITKKQYMHKVIFHLLSNWRKPFTTVKTRYFIQVNYWRLIISFFGHNIYLLYPFAQRFLTLYSYSHNSICLQSNTWIFWINISCQLMIASFFISFFLEQTTYFLKDCKPAIGCIAFLLHLPCCTPISNFIGFLRLTKPSSELTVCAATIPICDRNRNNRL